MSVANRVQDSVKKYFKEIPTRALQMVLGQIRLTTTELYLNLSPEDAN